MRALVGCVLVLCLCAAWAGASTTEQQDLDEAMALASNVVRDIDVQPGGVALVEEEEADEITVDAIMAAEAHNACCKAHKQNKHKCCPKKPAANKCGKPCCKKCHKKPKKHCKCKKQCKCHKKEAKKKHCKCKKKCKCSKKKKKKDSSSSGSSSASGSSSSSGSGSSSGSASQPMDEAAADNIKKDFVAKIHFKKDSTKIFDFGKDLPGDKKENAGGYSTEWQEFADKFTDVLLKLQGIGLKQYDVHNSDWIFYVAGLDTLPNKDKDDAKIKRAEAVACYMARWFNHKGIHQYTIHVGFYPGTEVTEFKGTDDLSQAQNRRAEVFFPQRLDQVQKFTPKETWRREDDGKMTDSMRMKCFDGRDWQNTEFKWNFFRYRTP